jgi:pSer/pThr/pTyr-binding forkhead associated (FHA) protein
VSRSHARLNFGPDGWVLTDLGSTNGTRVNGWVVNRPQVVRPGDRVSFGLQAVVITR